MRFPTPPKTYGDCLMRWERYSRTVARHGRIAVGYNTYLYRRSDRFVAEFHGHPIVTYHPGYKVIDACGYENSRTTQERLYALTGARVYSNKALGFHQNIRVNGYPYFSGMRIDDFGHVFEEDRKPDTKTVPVHAVAMQYAKLWRNVYKHLLARWELGEFQLAEAPSGKGYGLGMSSALVKIEQALQAEGVVFLPHDAVAELLYGDTTPEPPIQLKTLLDIRKAQLKSWWMHDRNGYEDIEVK